jgi:hypothetical protein
MGGYYTKPTLIPYRVEITEARVIISLTFSYYTASVIHPNIFIIVWMKSRLVEHSLQTVVLAHIPAFKKGLFGRNAQLRVKVVQYWFLRVT